MCMHVWALHVCMHVHMCVYVCVYVLCASVHIYACA